MTRLSILTSWPANDSIHEDTLASILQNRPAQCEIIVVHRGEYGDPYELASEVRFISAAPRASQLEMLNLGADEADGEILHIIQGGLEATDGWADAALEHFEEPEVVAVAPAVLDAGEERIVVAGVELSSAGSRGLCGVGYSIASTDTARLQPTGPALMAGFYRIDAWDAAWGLDNSMGETADIDLAVHLERLGRCSLATNCRLNLVESITSAESAICAGRNRQRLFLRHQQRQQLSPSGNKTASILEWATEFYRPTAWARALGRLTAKLSSREVAQAERRWRQVIEESTQTEVRRAA